MKHFFSILFAATFTLSGHAQELRNSLLQYQMNALALNPAYSSYEAATGFEATFLGNYISQNTVSRSVIVNMQGATEKGGLGLTFQFYRNSFLGEVNLRPSWSKRYLVSNGGEFSFGIVAGLNYFDVSNTFFSNNNDFVSIDAGFGLYYHLNRFFAGVSVLNLFEKTAGLDRSATNNQERENPYSLHVGGAFRINDDIDLKPVGLLRYINIYELPDQSFQNVAQAVSVDLQANVLVQHTYLVGFLFGFTDPNIGVATNRFGISATYILDRFRLTYAFQNNSQSDNRTSLPVTHIISAGYDIGGGDMERERRFF